MDPAEPTRPHQLTVVRVGDDPGAWRAAGFSVVDRGDGTGTVQVGRTSVELTGSGRGFEGWTLDGVGRPVDGLAPVEPWHPIEGRTVPAPHPNGVLRIDHVVLLTGDTARTVAELEAVGLEVRGHRAARASGRPVRQVFLWAGDVILELVGPGEGAPAEGGPTSVMGLALAVADLDASAHALGPLLGPARDAVQPGRQVATLRHAQAGMRLPLLFMSPHVDVSDGADRTVPAPPAAAADRPDAPEAD
ncbi:MAG: VOC family protein [Actinomycetes bacterium]